MAEGFKKEPFREPLESAGIFRRELGHDLEYAHLKKLKGAPDKLIREESGFKTTEEALAKYGLARDLFAQLRDRYGINVPGFDPVIAENGQGKRKVFLVVDKIEGVEVESLAEITPEVASALDHFYEQGFQSYMDAYLEQKPVLDDLGVKQLMYGRKKGDTEDKLYFVDIEPEFTAPGEAVLHNDGKEHPVDFEERMKDAFERLLEDMTGTEEQLALKVEFPKGHAKAEELARLLWPDAEPPKGVIPTRRPS